MRASPATRKLARDLGVDLSAVEGSGSRGQVTRQDVERAAAGATTPAAVRVAPGPPAGEDRIEPLQGLRRQIALNMDAAWRNVPHIFTFDRIDATGLVRARRALNEELASDGVKLSYMPFFVKACVSALQTFEGINAYIDGNEIEYHDYVDISVAVGTDKGLVVPVLRNVEAMSFAGIEATIKDYAIRAREGKLGIEEMTGGTFTISNGGVYGSLNSTPILNPPQSGILGLHAIQDRPMAVDGQVVIRPMMYVALSYDHRLVDGREAVTFLKRVKECVEDPARMLLET